MANDKDFNTKLNTLEDVIEANKKQIEERYDEILKLKEAFRSEMEA